MIETASIGNPRSRTFSQEGTLGPTSLGLIKVRIRMGALRKRSNWKRVHHLVRNPLTRPKEPRRLQVAKLTVAITAAIHFHLLAGGIRKDRAGNLLDHLRDPIRPDLPDHDLLRLHRGGADTDLHHVHPDLLIQAAVLEVGRLPLVLVGDVPVVPGRVRGVVIALTVNGEVEALVRNVVTAIVVESRTITAKRNANAKSKNDV